jgi:hypothetical protein
VREGRQRSRRLPVAWIVRRLQMGSDGDLARLLYLAKLGNRDAIVTNCPPFFSLSEQNWEFQNHLNCECFKCRP